VNLGLKVDMTETDAILAYVTSWDGKLRHYRTFRIKKKGKLGR
jgi:hypothetical protein